MVKKERNPQDATLRNIRALKHRVAMLETAIAASPAVWKAWKAEVAATKRTRRK